VGLFLSIDGLFIGQCSFVVVFLLCTGGCLEDRAAKLWFCYCVSVGCLVDRADMFCVCYCLSVGCFSVQGRYIVGFLLCTDG
jgi:hypothetical protein